MNNKAIISKGFMCPWCRESMLSTDESCGGSFLDIGHPSNVQAVAVQFTNGILTRESNIKIENIMRAL